MTSHGEDMDRLDEVVLEIADAVLEQWTRDEVIAWIRLAVRMGYAAAIHDAD